MQRTTWDSRIIRLIEALSSAGHEVILVSPDRHPEIRGLNSHHTIPAYQSTRGALLRNLALMSPATVMETLALPLHRKTKTYRRMLDLILQAKPDIIHANDWITLPAAIDAAALTGAKVIYDTHEVATQEHSGRRWWRLFAQRYISMIEAAFIGKADHVITVSNGIAGFLSDRYPDSIKALTVIRNLPKPPAQYSFKKTDGIFKLAYSGLIRPERHIDIMIKALHSLGLGYSLELTGFGPAAYIEDMKQLARSLKVDAQIVWHQPVHPDSITTHLSASDVGLYLSDGKNAQQRYAMPNKIFEYISAGLPVISAGSLDVKVLLETHKNGIALDDINVGTIVGAIHLIKGEVGERMKAHSIEALASLDHLQEQAKLIAIYEKLLSDIQKS
jgi:glycogen synthase